MLRKSGIAGCLLLFSLFLSCRQQSASSANSPLAGSSDSAEVAIEDASPEAELTENNVVENEPTDIVATVEMTVRDIPHWTQRDKVREFTERHKDAWLAVSGFVYNVGALRPGGTGEIQSAVILCAMKKDAPEFESYNVDADTFLYCFTPGMQPWKLFGPGAKVILRGKYNDKGHLEKCTITEAKGDPVTTFTAVELAEVYEAEPEKTDKKYGSLSNQIIVTGTIQGFSGDGGNMRPVLSGTDKVDIHVDYAFFDQFDGLQPGDEITVIAKPIFVGLDADIPISLGDSQRIDLAK